MWANTGPDDGLIAVGVADSGAFKGVDIEGAKRLNELDKAHEIYAPDAYVEQSAYMWKMIRVCPIAGFVGGVLVAALYNLVLGHAFASCTRLPRVPEEHALCSILLTCRCLRRKAHLEPSP